MNNTDNGKSPDELTDAQKAAITKATGMTVEQFVEDQRARMKAVAELAMRKKK